MKNNLNSMKFNKDHYSVVHFVFFLNRQYRFMRIPSLAVVHVKNK